VTIADVTWPQRTERLLLRRFRDADVDRLLEFRNRPDVYRWLLRTVVDRDELLAAWRRTLTDERDLSSVVELGGTVIGTASLSIHDGMGQDRHDALVGAEADVGYLLDPAYAGQGYGTEIARALLHLAFDVVGVHRATAGCYADNLASVRILEKVGMRREQYGVKDSWHAELGWIDGATYGILAEEWRATAAGASPGG